MDEYQGLGEEHGTVRGRYGGIFMSILVVSIDLEVGSIRFFRRAGLGWDEDNHCGHGGVTSRHYVHLYCIYRYVSSGYTACTAICVYKLVNAFLGQISWFVCPYDRFDVISYLGKVKWQLYLYPSNVVQSLYVF